MRLFHDFLKEEESAMAKKTEAVKKEESCKPGIYIKGSGLYLDINARRFRSIVSLSDFCRKIFPADCVTKEGKTYLTAKAGHPALTVELPLEELWQVCRLSRYGEWMEETELL